MLHSVKLSHTLILCVLALDFQLALATTLPLHIRQQSIYYYTTTLTATIEEIITLVITLDSTGPLSTTESDSSTSGSLSATVSSTSSTATSTVRTLSASLLSTSSSASSGYVFNSQSTNNVAVYFGQTNATSGTSLAKQCADQNIDIVILAFVVSRNESNGLYPGVNFGAACSGQTPLMETDAPGLLFCSELATDIDTCQITYGKKVLLSIGGGGQSIIFNAASDASAFGTILWDLFGPPGNVDINLRPFGDVSINGFDINNEDNNNAYYDILGSTLKALFASNNTKDFYLSAAPQCPNPDASDPTSLLLLCDFVWIQFYNNPSCDIGAPGFSSSLRGWSQTLSSGKARIYVGAPAWPGADSVSYKNIGTAQGIEAVAKNAKGLGLANFGGVMFWDGPEGMLNQDGGKDIIAWAKTGLIT